MAVGDEDDGKNKFETGKWIYVKLPWQYDGFFIFIRHDSAEIWGLKYGLTLVIGTLKIMASTSVFVRVDLIQLNI
jgi:hypothetical protein